jgi:hypothetical protein
LIPDTESISGIPTAKKKFVESELFCSIFNKMSKSLRSTWCCPTSRTFPKLLNDGNFLNTRECVDQVDTLTGSNQAQSKRGISHSIAEDQLVVKFGECGKASFELGPAAN